MSRASEQAALSEDRRILIKTLATEFDEMGWRNLRYIERILSPYGLTFAQAMVLSALQRLGPNLIMSSIADLTRLPASTITSIMDRLVKGGLAERQPGAKDRRSITGSITPEGEQILTDLERIRNVSLISAVVDFSDEELTVILKFSQRWGEITESNQPANQ